MKPDDLEEELRAYILREHLPGEAPESLGVEDDLINSGILDSMAMVSLVTHLERQYGVALGAEEMTPEHLGSVAALARLVRAKSAGQSS